MRMRMNNLEASVVTPNAIPGRLSRWAEIDATVNGFSEQKHGMSIDAGINDLVVGLNALFGGYVTRMSCEGHPENSISPWVSFSIASGNSELEQERLSRLTTLLDGFYEHREEDVETRLGIYPISEAGPGAYEITTQIGHSFFDETADLEEVSRRAVELLPVQQLEVCEFAAYIRDAYVSGLVVDDWIEQKISLGTS